MRGLPRFCLSIFAAFIGVVRIIGAADEENGEFRTVEVTVLDAQGKPAPRVQVFLRGLERDAMGMNEFSLGGDWTPKTISTPPGWLFVTDSRGRFTARFGMFKSIEREDEGHAFLPGWGTFYFVAMKSGTAGAVSPQIENYSWESGERGSSRRDRDEWSRGRTIRLLDSMERVSMRFRRGLEVDGRVINPQGQPLSGVEFSLIHDLHAWSHTGGGGEVFIKNAVSDRSGRFVFRRVYPARFDLQMSMPDQNLYWEKTKIRRKLSGEMVDEIGPRPGERSISVIIVAARDVRFRYFGRITDAAGQPVSGATVAIGISAHRVPKTWGDDHHFLEAIADQDGRYEISATSPFARFMRVSARGFKDGVRDFDRGPVAPPGRYDFSLNTEETSEEKK